MSRKYCKIFFFIDIALLIVLILSRWHIRLTLYGEENIIVPLGQEYVEPGASARFIGKDIHALDGDMEVKISGEVDTNVTGTYTVQYKASRLLYSASATRTVTVLQDDAPTIVLGEVDTMLDVGDVWTDSYEAYDDHDGDITAQVVVEGEVDQSIIGSYDLVYTVTDSVGNTATATRTVRVIGASQPITGSKIVFLTFDDGPWSSTDELLETLARHNAKATFFVTANHPENLDCIAREYEQGHTGGAEGTW